MQDTDRIKGNLALSPQKVLVIEASNGPEAAQLRVAAYCRVSSDSSDQLNSFMAQLNHYTELISSQKSWTLVDIYSDEGITGTSAQKRPDFQRLLTDCRKGKIDKILVKSISRFARNTVDCLTTVRELKSIGVGVCFEEQKIDTSNMTGEMMTAMFASIAQKESESISGNMRWSYKQRMMSGSYVPCVLPYGYTRVNGKIEIDEERAEVIRRIFSWYLTGHSTDAIASMLNTQKVTSRYGGVRWSQTAVRYILTNEKYAGNSLWQKYYTTDTLPYQHPLNRGQRDSYYAENTHKPIVSTKDFTAAQELMAKRRMLLTPEQNIPYPFRKKIFCGECESVFRRKVIRGIVYWACTGHDKKGSGFCSVMQVPELVICEAFLRLYYKLKVYGKIILSQFGVNAEILIDHAWGWEPCTIADVKAYKPENKSIVSGQVLQFPYDYQKAKLVVREMADALALELVDKKLMTNQLVLTVGYDRENLDDPNRRQLYHGPITTDRYGRKIPKHAVGTGNFSYTSSANDLLKEITALYDLVVNKNLLVRRLSISANKLLPENAIPSGNETEQLDLFTDYAAKEAQERADKAAHTRERKLQETMLGIKKRYGKNAILKGMNLEEGATARERNQTIGGHHE